MTDEPQGVTDITDGEKAPTTGGIRWFAVVLLVAYLALLVIGNTSLWRIAGGGVTAWSAMGVFTVLYILGWRLWLAVGSRRRLAFRDRVTVHLVGGPVIIILASLAGVWLPATMALSIIVMCDALNERDRRPVVDDSAPDLI